MNVILFGAGASRGAGDVFPEQPPLGAQLFLELAKSFPRTWGAFPSTVTDVFNRSFETGMQLLWDNHSQVVAELMQHMALYFIQFRPRHPGSTLYCSFAKELRTRSLHDTLLLSTLNYECLLEHSLSANGLPIDYFNFPRPGGPVSVFKLHGSCNMLPRGLQATRGITFTRGVTFGTSVQAVPNPNDVVTFCLGNNSLPPVMCLFMKSKPTQVAPRTITAIQELWRSQVATAQKVFIVGVNPNQEDAHLWDALSNTPAEIIFVGNTTAFVAWQREHRVGMPCQILGSRFDQTFDTLMNQILR